MTGWLSCCKIYYNKIFKKTKLKRPIEKPADKVVGKLSFPNFEKSKSFRNCLVGDVDIYAWHEFKKIENYEKITKFKLIFLFGSKLQDMTKVKLMATIREI